MNILWFVLFGRMNVKPKPRNLWKESNIEDIMKIILKEYEDKYGCKGRGSVQEISSLMNIFKDRWWSLSWKASRPTYFQKIWWRCILSQIDQYQLQEEYISHILERMKLSNLKEADLFQVKEDDCNIVVN